MHVIMNEEILIFTKDCQPSSQKLPGKMYVAKSDKRFKNYLLSPQVKFSLSRIGNPSIRLFKFSDKSKAWKKNFEILKDF